MMTNQFSLIIFVIGCMIGALITWTSFEENQKNEPIIQNEVVFNEYVRIHPGLSVEEKTKLYRAVVR